MKTMEHLLRFVFIIAFCHTGRILCADDCERRLTCQECVSGGNLLRPSPCSWCPLELICRPTDSKLITCYKQTMWCPNNEPQTQFNSSTAFTNLLLSSVAYAENPSQCISDKMPELKEDGYVIWDSIGVKCDFYFDYDDCFVLVAVSNKKNTIAVIFRGTNNIWQLVDQLFSAAYTDLFEKTHIPKQDGLVNAYFKNAYEKMYKCVKSSVNDLLKTTNKQYNVVVTGHSLGGALAALTAVSLIKDRIITAERLTLYTYGEPKVGDKKFAYNFNSIVKQSWRIVHALDIVSFLPPIGESWFHHNTMVYYPNDTMLKDSMYYVCSNNRRDPRCKQDVITDLIVNNNISWKNAFDYIGCIFKNRKLVPPALQIAIVKCIGFTVRDIVINKFIEYVNQHIYYFNVDVGSHCSPKKRTILRIGFANSTCMRTPITRPSNLLADTEVKSSKSSNCTFEENFCDWSRRNSNWINWLRHKGQTDTARKTGPEIDRFLNSTGFFIFVDASNNAGKTAKLRSANFPIDNYCVSFDYNMYGDDDTWLVGPGDHTGTLRLKLSVNGTSQEIWTRTGNQGNTWQYMACSIRTRNGLTGVLFFELEAAVGKSYLSDIAIDNVSIQPRTCLKENCSKQGRLWG